MTVKEFEQKLLEYLAKNPQISTDDIYTSSFFNDKEFVYTLGHGELRIFHNLYIYSKNKNWCFSISPFAVYPVAKTANGSFCIVKKQGDKYYKVTTLEHYKTAFELSKIPEIQYLHIPIVNNFKTAKEYYDKNRVQNQKELLNIAKKIDENDNISFGELVIAQNLINHLEHKDLKIYNNVTYGKFEKDN